MKYRVLSQLIVIALIAIFCGADASDKQKQLEKLQSDTKKAESKLEQTVTKKQQKETEIQKTKTAKVKTEKELRTSQQIANLKLSSLNNVNEELESVEGQINDLKALQTAQLEILIREKRLHSVSQGKYKYQHCVAQMATQTRDKMNDLGDIQLVLSEEHEQKGAEYIQANAKFQEDYSVNRNLDKKVKNLEYEKKQLTKEQQQLETKITKLRKDAAQLESLMGKIASQPPKEPASYKFSAKTISWPLKGSIIRSFGEESRSYGTSVVCDGIDIAAPEWSTVVAADAGEVVFSGTYGGQGKLVILDHKNGFFTVYAYNNEILVSSGATVKKGQAIAKSGMTGSATVPSLHFEVRKGGKAVNPLAYLD